MIKSWKSIKKSQMWFCSSNKVVSKWDPEGKDFFISGSELIFQPSPAQTLCKNQKEEAEVYLFLIFFFLLLLLFLPDIEKSVGGGSSVWLLFLSAPPCSSLLELFWARPAGRTSWGPPKTRPPDYVSQHASGMSQDAAGGGGGGCWADGAKTRQTRGCYLVSLFKTLASSFTWSCRRVMRRFNLSLTKKKHLRYSTEWKIKSLR